MTSIGKCMCLPFYPDPTPTASSPWVSDPEQLYFVSWHLVHIQPLHDRQCMVLITLTSACNSHTDHQMWYKQTHTKKGKDLRVKIRLITFRTVVCGAAECTLVSQWVQTLQIQPPFPDLAIVLLCSLLLLRTTVSQSPALSKATSQIHQGLRHLSCPEPLIWTMKPAKGTSCGNPNTCCL